MVSLPLTARSVTHDGDTYLVELESLFDHWADSGERIRGHDDGEELPGPPISARGWFFDQPQQPLDLNVNKRVIGQVALGLLRRVEDQVEADTARRVLESALLRASYKCTKSAVAGSKRKRDEGWQQP